MKTYFDGLREGIRMYAWWKDGIQYVGTTGRTLKEALAEIDEEEKKNNKEQAILLDKSLDRAAKEPF